MRDPGGNDHGAQASFRPMPLTPELAGARRPRFELGPVGRRRPARHAQPHHARRGAARASRGAHGARVLAGDPVRPDRAAVGQRAHARAHQSRAAHLHRQRRVHRRHPRLHDERRLVPHGLAGRRRTGTRSRTSATTASSTTTRRTPSCTADGGAARLGIEHFGPVATRGVLLDIARAARRRPLRRQLRDHRRRPRARRGRGRRRRRAGRRGARAHRADALPARRRQAALLDARRPACRRSRSSGSATTTSPRSRPTR